MYFFYPYGNLTWRGIIENTNEEINLEHLASSSVKYLQSHEQYLKDIRCRLIFYLKHILREQ